MVQIVDLPDGTEGEFPDNMSAAQIEAVLQRQFPQETAVAVEEPPIEEDDGGILGSLRRIAKQGLGTLETGAAFVTGAGAEVAAGLGGFAKTITTGPQAGQQVIEDVRKGLTFQPRTEAGKAQLEAVGGFLQPVGEALQTAETFLGDAVFEATGSPTLSAAAATIPVVTLEVLGLKGASKLAKRKGIKQAAKREKLIAKELQKAAPTVEELKNVARGVYKEIDELGATIKPDQYNKLVNDIQAGLKDGGFRPRIDDKVAKLLDEFNAGRGGIMSVADIDDLRTVAQGFAKSIEPKTKALGNSIIDNIDDFLDADNVLSFPKGTPANVGQRYKIARKFWGQARKSETLQEMVELAEANRGGFVNGIRTEFLKLVRNKKRNKFFTKEELTLIKEVADGGKGVNIFKNLAKLKINRAGGGSLIPLAGPGGALISGIATGDISTGLAGLLFPLVGEVSEVLAIKLTKGNAKFADDVLRAGKDGRAITKAYLEHVPKGKRSTAELAELLKDPDLDVSKLPKTKFTEEAMAIAEQIRRERGQVVATATVAETQRQAQEQ